jgi:hypothetical protein
MTEKSTTPGYYFLKSLVIIPEVTGQGRDLFSEFSNVEISGLIPEIGITESIDSDTIYGYFNVIDSVGLLENFPLRGEERMKMTIIDSLENERDYDLFCYKIDSVSSSLVNDFLTYNVHFISYQSFRAGNHKIRKSYKDVPITYIADDIFDKYYTTRRSARPEDFGAFPSGRIRDRENKSLIRDSNTQGNVRLIIPDMTPAEAMNFISKRAYSEVSKSCSFRFFENTNGYYFVSDERMFELAENRNKAFEFTYSDSIPKEGNFFKEQMDNIEHMSNNKRFNTIDDMYNGAYRNKVLVIDIMNRVVNLKEEGYDYLSEREKYFNGKFVGALDRHTDTFARRYFKPEVQKRFVILKDYDDDEGFSSSQMSGNLRYKEIVSNRIAYRKHLESITIDAVGPGRLDITAGDIISLNMLEFSSQTKTPTTNIQLSGKYIVKSVSHVMSRDIMKNKYTLMKKEWAEVIDSPIRDFKNRLKIDELRNII